MDINIYNAIADFVSALHEVYDNNKPLALYNRLLINTPIRDKERIKKHISIFSNYLNFNQKFILEGNLTNISIIKYNDSIFIDIPLFLKKSDKELVESIKKHLLTIMISINPNLNIGNALTPPTPQMNPMMSMLGGIMDNGNIGDMMNNAMSMMGGIEGNNPLMEMMKNLGNMRDDIETGNVAPTKLFALCRNMMDGLEKQMTDISVEEQIEEEMKKQKN